MPRALGADAGLTPLGVVVLALLREDDMHPYEMLRLLRHRHADRMVKLTNGTFYHTVARLERKGLIAEVGVDRAGNRPERTTYTLTEAGPNALQAWVRSRLARTDRGEHFVVALAEAHNLDRDEVAALIGRRLAALRDERDVIDDTLARVRERGIAEQFVVEFDRRQALLRADIAWTTSFLQRLGRSDHSWGPDDLPAAHIEAGRALRKAALQ